MKKFNRFIQIVWLAVAAVAAVEAFKAYSDDNGFSSKVYLMIGVFFAAIIMYAIRKRQGRSYK